ncbi:MAG TPA: MarR family EPS-associated transcriptional regulator [Arenicellales bacterium]|nr:MarR family EPS-associated transcriptional regulator [Arenicellales bacterium]
MPTTLPDETRYRLLKYLESNPDASQRALARELGVSLGKVNYCVKALVDRGWVTVGRFRRSNNKLAYVYKLTPRGLEAKADATVRFLNRKLAEYETLQGEIATLRDEARKLGISE